MRKILATFSGERFHATTKALVEDGPKFGADEIWVHDNIWLEKCRPEHWAAARWFREHPRNRGVDWFCFKPETVRASLQAMSDDDVLLFVDGDCRPLADLTPIFNIIARDGIMLFRCNGWPLARVWTKRAMFKIMDLDKAKYWDSQCVCARFMGFTKAYLPFVEEWLKYCLIPDANTFDLTDGYGAQIPGFQEHRCEQACLGLLAAKHSVQPLYREACQWGEEKSTADSKLNRDLYPQLFEHIWGNTYAPGLSPSNPGFGSAFRNRGP